MEPEFGRVTIKDMALARERRAAIQREYAAKYGVTIISFAMNIPGETKNSPLISKCFTIGLSLIKDKLTKLNAPVLDETIIREKTGNEAILAVNAAAGELKREMVKIEDRKGGRLFDIDVIDGNFSKLSREQFGLKPRKCLVCGKPAFECARSRRHGLETLEKKTNGLLVKAICGFTGEKIAAAAKKAMLAELRTTPKPGLVDKRNSGSHCDMNEDTFVKSIAAISPYMRLCAKKGTLAGFAGKPPELSDIRTDGLDAEKKMFAATGGANTHKGAIFSLGIMCYASGYAAAVSEDDGFSAEAIFRISETAAYEAIAADFRSISAGNAVTAGERLFAESGIMGARGQAANGFPDVRNTGLPALLAGLQAGHSLNESGRGALLALIAEIDDTNMMKRGGIEKARLAKFMAADAIRHNPYPATKEIELLDDRFIAENLSPGGAADLLILSYFLLFLTVPQDNGGREWNMR